MKKFRVPKGKTEEEVVRIVNKVVKRLSSKFVFGYHEKEDIAQEAWIYAIEALEKYDYKKPLENFLWIHVKNRLCNFKRDNFERIQKPCLECPHKCDSINDKSCTGFDDVMECDWYNRWFVLNSAKRNLMSPIDLGSVNDENENSMKLRDNTEISAKEIVGLIDKKLTGRIRAIWVKFQHGVTVLMADRIKLQEKISQILEEEGIDGETWKVF